MNSRLHLTFYWLLVAVVVWVPSWGNTYEDSNSYARDERTVIEQINTADESCTWMDLTSILAYCSTNFSNSMRVSAALTTWLHENHHIYSGKSPIEVRQFKGFLMYSLSKFLATEDLHTYVTYELQTTTKVFNLAAAAHTAKILNTHVDDLVPLLNHQLQRIIQDEWVDITTYTLDYPLKKPTKATYEIIKTLGAFGHHAQSAAQLLSQIAQNENKHLVDKDTLLIQLVNTSLQKIRPKKRFACCSRKPSSVDIAKTLYKQHKIIDKKERSILPIKELGMMDQHGKKIAADDLLGTPFVLTFFYTGCANALKCASTLEKLGELQKLIKKSNLSDKVAIYAMTYDPDVDSPELLRNYGKTFEIKFSDHVKFLIPQPKDKIRFFNAMDLKVNFGAGTVNHHGSQLFICDAQGNIAVSYDNTIWKSEDILQKLIAIR